MAKPKFETEPKYGWIPDSPENQLPGFDADRHTNAHIMSSLLEQDVQRNTVLPSQLRHLLGDQSHLKHNSAIEGLGDSAKDLFFDNPVRGLFNGIKTPKLHWNEASGLHGFAWTPTPENETISDRISAAGNSVLSGRQHLDSLKRGATTGEVAVRTASEFNPGGVLDQADKALTSQSKKIASLMKLTDDYIPQRLTYVRNPDPEMQDDGEPETGSYRYQ
jgi:hypothetical protein